jgi:DNA-binding HxlR family transcriptional regulator
VIGERWNLLVVRELTLGPRRYRDLQDGLPGIPTNLLAARLRDLQEAGVITRRTLPPPTGVAVYELTEAGQALRPAMRELRAWGQRYAPAPADTDVVQPAWALLSAAGRATDLPEGRWCELRVGPEFFHLGAADSRLTVHGGPAPSPDGTLTIPADALYRLMSGNATAARRMTIAGDPRVTRPTVESLRGALTDLASRRVPRSSN